jgi:hypothetical protein
VLKLKAGLSSRSTVSPLRAFNASEDLVSFRRVASNKDVDPLSRHFHYIAFDGEQGLLVATLGDGNVVRVAVSQDHVLAGSPYIRVHALCSSSS